MSSVSFSDARNEVLDLLVQRSITCVEAIKPSYSGYADVALFIPSDRISRKVSVGKTSTRQLRSVIASLADRGIVAEWVQVPPRGGSGMREALHALLAERFPNVSLSLLDGLDASRRPALLIQVDAPGLGEAVENEMRGIAQRYFEVARLTVPAVYVENSSAGPSALAILRATKILSPAHPAAVRGAFENTGTFTPDVEWLKRRLDTLRRNGFLIRGKDGRYSLSARGLDALPHVRGKKSSDVARALALGRRDWVEGGSRSGGA